MLGGNMSSNRPEIEPISWAFSRCMTPAPSPFNLYWSDVWYYMTATMALAYVYRGSGESVQEFLDRIVSPERSRLADSVSAFVGRWKDEDPDELMHEYFKDREHDAKETIRAKEMVETGKWIPRGD